MHNATTPRLGALSSWCTSHCLPAPHGLHGAEASAPCCRWKAASLAMPGGMLLHQHPSILSQAFKGWSGAALAAQLSYNGPWVGIKRLLRSPTPSPEQEAEINYNPQWTENSAVLQPMVLIRNIFKYIYMFSLSAGGIGRDRSSHSRHMFSLFAVLFSPFPQRKDQKGFLLL